MSPSLPTPALRPADLNRGHFYTSPMGSGGMVEIVSVGPKWITFREWYQDYARGQMVVSGVCRLPRSGWELSVFREVALTPLLAGVAVWLGTILILVALVDYWLERRHVELPASHQERRVATGLRDATGRRVSAVTRPDHKTRSRP